MHKVVLREYNKTIFDLEIILTIKKIDFILWPPFWFFLLEVFLAYISLLKDNIESSIKFSEGSKGSEEKYFIHKLQEIY